MDQETREMVFKLGNGYCMCSDDCSEIATDAHHMLSNTRTNRKLYPLFIDSIFNLISLNSGCHLNKPIPKIRPHQAAIYERWLEKFKSKGE